MKPRNQASASASLWRQRQSKITFCARYRGPIFLICLLLTGFIANTLLRSNHDPSEEISAADHNRPQRIELVKSSKSSSESHTKADFSLHVNKGKVSTSLFDNKNAMADAISKLDQYLSQAQSSASIEIPKIPDSVISVFANLSLVALQNSDPNSNVRVCEIGFGLGHIAAAFLSVSDRMRYLGFDFESQQYWQSLQPMEPFKYISENVGVRDRIEVVWDATSVLQSRLRESPPCDIGIFHGRGAVVTGMSDLATLIQSVEKHSDASNKFLIAMNCDCSDDKCKSVNTAWGRYTHTGKVLSLGKVGRKNNKDALGMCWGTLL